MSMDGRGRWADNVFVERLWRSLKYEHVYPHAYKSVDEARRKIRCYFEFYNSRRPHSSLGTDYGPGILPRSARSSGGLNARQSRPWKCRSYGKRGKP